VVIPFDPAGDPCRDQALDFVRCWYARQDLDVVVSSVLSTEPWSKGVAVDRGVETAETDLLVVADADCLVQPAALRACLEAVDQGAPWSQPHGPVIRLRAQATRLVLAGGRIPFRPGRVHGPPGGGVVVLSRDAYDTAGGPDPRFVGWGGEDISWARALDTLLGPCVRFAYPLVHLWHRPAPRRATNRASAESELLAGRYYDAAGHPAEMRMLVAETSMRSGR
jgi:hypothetical protein